MTGALSSLRIGHVNRSRATSYAIALAAFVCGCPASRSTGSKDAGVAPAPPKITVSATREDLIFTFQDPKTGAFVTATSVDEIPESARAAVVVTDLSLSPEKRQAGRYVYVTDLKTARDDGTYPVAVASRYGFEAHRTGTATAAVASRGEVIVYSAAWCGVCKTTKRLLKKWGVAFVEKDIEASRSAQQELANKAARANIRPGGVPVIDVAGVLLQGLDERQLRGVLEDKGLL